MLVAVMLQLRPAKDRLIVPVNPFSPLTVIVDVPVTPARIVTAVGLAVIVKSTIWKTMLLVVCDRPPLVPVTLTV